MPEDAPIQPAPSWSEQQIILGGLTMSFAQRGDVRSVTLHGELDLDTAHGVEHELDRVAACDAGPIVVDLAGLTFVGSAGVRALLSAHARSHSDRLTLLRGPDAVQRIFDLTGATERLPFAD